MKDTKFTMPAGPGINLVFPGFVEALSVGKIAGLAALAVDNGAILRFDAVLGEDLLARPNAKWDKPLKADGWYGTIDAIGFAVGPFLRKSFAMNGLALAIMGLPVEPVGAEAEEQAAEPTEAELMTKRLVEVGVPEEYASVMAEQLLEQFPGMPPEAIAGVRTVPID